MGKTVVCRAGEMQDHIDGDLDSDIHKGFTVGKRGKIMYWYFIWHGGTTGGASIFTAEQKMRRSYIKADQIIVVHFKD